MAAGHRAIRHPANANMTKQATAIALATVSSMSNQSMGFLPSLSCYDPVIAMIATWKIWTT
jgi:hypothetical protein